MNIIDRFGIPGARHLYLIEVARGWIYVSANNRTQAAAHARRAGYEPLSVSMEG
jgi:hypothetical protein